MTTRDDLPLGLHGVLLLSAKDHVRYRKLWHRERKGGIGASEISAILGLNKFVTPLDIWMDKRSTVEANDEDMPEAAYWGLKHEHNVATEFAKRNPHLGKIYPTPGLLAHPDHPEVRATLDRVLIKRRVNPPTAVAAVECKTVSEYAYKNYWADGLPPIHIQLQCQYQMAVTGLERVYVPHLVGGNYMPEAYLAERDQSVIDQLVNYAVQWWHDHITLGQRPEVIFGDAEKLSELWPGNPSLKALRADPEMMDWIGKYADARRREHDAKDEKTIAAFQIQKRMGDHEAVEDQDGRELLTWKLPAPSYTIDVERLKLEQPLIAQEYQIPKQNSRRMYLKEIAA